MIADAASFAGLFASAFLAGSILPAQSEAVLAALLIAGRQPAWALLLVASLGNVAGAVLNYGLGRSAGRFRHRRWFPLSARGWMRAHDYWGRWGKWSLLLSWLPVIGDGFTLVAGTLRTPFWQFLALVSLAKTGRYLALAALIDPLGFG